MSLEPRLADAQIDIVALRDPNAIDHKVTFADLQKSTPHFDWSDYFRGAGISTADLNVDQPKFMAQLDKEFQSTPVADWKIYLKWQLLNNAASHLSAPFV